MSRPLPSRIINKRLGSPDAKKAQHESDADLNATGGLVSPKEFNEDRAKNSIKTRVNNITYQDEDYEKAQAEKNDLMK